ncbi:MAG: methyltransferase domain-containing protein [Myxococcales bacterium FL481]|nr:MAG: methyltransferase domain-containing protein [Myxococcales bacterium FL481]
MSPGLEPPRIIDDARPDAPDPERPVGRTDASHDDLADPPAWAPSLEAEDLSSPEDVVAVSPPDPPAVIPSLTPDELLLPEDVVAVPPDAADVPAANDDPDAAAPVAGAAAPDEVFEEAELEPAELHHDELVEVVEDEAEDAEPAEIRTPPAPPPPTPGPTKRRRAWLDDTFGEQFAALAPRDVAESAARDVEFVLASCLLERGARVLDVGCGLGHHALAFAQRGLSVTGLDSSKAQLAQAARLNDAAGSPVTLRHGDMRQLELDGEFDLVTCLGSTFGYFDDEQNAACLDQMKRQLCAGGRLVLQVLNRDFVVGHVPSRSWWQGRGCLVLDEADLDFAENRLQIDRTIVFEDARQFEHHMYIRAYALHELGRMLASLGMRMVEVSGSRATPRHFFGAASPDIWIVAERRT